MDKIVNKVKKLVGYSKDYIFKEINIDREFLKDIKKNDCIFPDIDYRIYR